MAAMTRSSFNTFATGLARLRRSRFHILHKRRYYTISPNCHRIREDKFPRNFRFKSPRAGRYSKNQKLTFRTVFYKFKVNIIPRCLKSDKDFPRTVQFSRLCLNKPPPWTCSSPRSPYKYSPPFFSYYTSRSPYLKPLIIRAAEERRGGDIKRGRS